jgi:RHS repeat-associated protein
VRTVLPDGGSVTNQYYDTGELKKTFGTRIYPVEYTYDAQGRMTNMITWTGFASGAGAANTFWKHDGYRGFLTNKVYADGKGPSYGYTKAGRLAERKWARGITTAYNTNTAGEVMAVIYSDGTRAITNAYDRLGRLITIQHGSGRSVTRTYHDTGRLLSEGYSGGPLNGLTLTNGYDSLQRRRHVGISGRAAAQTSYAYDGASRLLRVTNATDQAEYSYLANSKLSGNLTFKRSTNIRMTTTRQHDNLNRLTEIASVPSGTNSFYPLTYRYAYNDANQRIRTTHADGSYWIYHYDSLGQVKSGKKYWVDGTPVAGQQFEYAHDDIGNRTQTKAGGDSQGQGLRTAAYTANNLNQYTGRDVPGAIDIIGIAHGLATITLDGTAAYRRGEYFHGLLSTNNTGATYGVYPKVDVIASLTGTNQTNSGNIFLPKTPEGFTYDDDGNMTQDGRWVYTWDGENRLKSLESYSAAPSGSLRKIQFEYDYMGRRIERIVSTNNGTSYVGQSTNRFMYDGWNMFSEFEITPSVTLARVYVWGSDLSGTMQGAGGVGGLLMVRQVTAAQTHFVAYDGNGNVTGLANASNGNISANYEYDPFGQTIRASGVMALLNPIRFSTKYTDDATDMLYYGYRYYNSSTGRWLSRDPLGELGFEVLRNGRINLMGDGPNLYTFVRNNPIIKQDRWGLSILCGCNCGPDITSAVEATLQDIRDQFGRLDWLQKDGGCGALYFPPWRAVDAWDMLNVQGFSWQPTPIERQHCSSCLEEVTYKGGCYSLSQINYIMFGLVNKLCDDFYLFGFPVEQAERAAFWGKIGRGMGTDEAVQVMGFVNHGYSGSPLNVRSSRCAPRSTVATFNITNWHWENVRETRP